MLRSGITPVQKVGQMLEAMKDKATKQMQEERLRSDPRRPQGSDPWDFLLGDQELLWIIFGRVGFQDSPTSK